MSFTCRCPAYVPFMVVFVLVFLFGPVFYLASTVGLKAMLNAWYISYVYWYVGGAASFVAILIVGLMLCVTYNDSSEHAPSGSSSADDDDDGSMTRPSEPFTRRVRRLENGGATSVELVGRTTTLV